jgi:hypothetical protein
LRENRDLIAVAFGCPRKEEQNVRKIPENWKAQPTGPSRLLSRKTLCLSFVVASLGLMLFSSSLGQEPKINGSVIPKTWDSQAIDAFQMQLADPTVSRKLISSAYYYSIPVRPIYKSHDVYRPDREPTGYVDQLKRQEPQVIFDSSKLKSEADWTKAGELVFDAPIGLSAMAPCIPRFAEWTGSSRTRCRLPMKA